MTAPRSPDSSDSSTRDTHALRFRRAQRLPDADAFGRVFKKAKRSRDRFFTVLYRKNGGNEPRLGLAVAKKHCRKATGRNRIKRVVRESFRLHADYLGGLDIVVINTPATHRVKNDELSASLAAHWRRCGTGTASDAGQGTR